MSHHFTTALILLGLTLPLQAANKDTAAPTAAPTAEQLEFFEKKVRPLLVQHCHACHSDKAKKLQAELRLDRRADVLKGGESGPAIVPGQPDKSLLVRAIRYQINEMPPGGKLKPTEIAVLVKWVRLGAPWPKEKSLPSPRAADGSYDWAKLKKNHWAYRPLGKPPLPQVKRKDWGHNEIDRFVLARLEAAGLPPAQPADRRTLIRRVSFDLVGLPPTPEQVDEFVRDERPDAWARLVDRLLDSTHYGERWARHWLDVARYSDGFGGFLDGAALPHAWQYRDWVVRSFNRDLPFDRFVRHQVAGDLLDEPEAFFGSGFFAIGPTYRSDGGDPDSVAQARSETLDDRVDTLTRGFLGLTVACARCHAHKFDPIPQEDYYSLAGIFNNTASATHPVAPPETVRKYNEQQQAIKTHDAAVKKLAAEIKRAGPKASDARKQELARLQAELKQLRAAALKLPLTHALRDTGSKNMALALRGNLRKPGPVVPRRFLRILAGEKAPVFTRGSGRLELADALVAPDNPLTPTVFVNRVWKWHFDKPLVGSLSNFGALGQQPTHPGLLAWLAADFVENGWSIKQLHRTILLSATYRQSSDFHARAFSIDGDNRLLWRMNPHRLDVEAWRDSLLAVSGELDLKLGGPPLSDVRGSRRRTIYFQVSRTGDRFATDTFLRLFDFPIPRASIAKRPISTVPQQFLFLLNSPLMIDRARALVARLAGEKLEQRERIERTYRLLFGRLPSQAERQLGQAFLAAKETTPKKDPAADLLITDFEGDSYGKWTAQGDAFGKTPPRGTLPNQMAVSGFRGQGLVNTYLRGDGTTGTLTSPEFTIERKRIAFLIGGGAHRDGTCINLLVSGTVVRTAAGKNNERLDWGGWDVADLKGKTAQLQIVDRVRGGWGHINIDHIVQTDRQQVRPTRGRGLDNWTQYVQVLLSSNEFMFVR